MGLTAPLLRLCLHSVDQSRPSNKIILLKDSVEPSRVRGERLSFLGKVVFILFASFQTYHDLTRLRWNDRKLTNSLTTMLPSP
jgi:hypothetical protein